MKKLTGSRKRTYRNRKAASRKAKAYSSKAYSRKAYRGGGITGVERRLFK